MFGIDDAVSAGLQIGGKLIDRLWPDPAQAAAAKLELLKMQQSGELAQLAADTDVIKGQIAVNQAEAANASIFVSGWRPAVGWMCAAGVGTQFLVGPLATRWRFRSWTPARCCRFCWACWVSGECVHSRRSGA